MKKLSVVLVLLLVLVVSTAAQESIALGDTVESELEGEPLSYTFSASAGDFMTISLASENFDAYLTLNDADGNLVAEDDDSGDFFNALLSTVIPADGEYTIVVSAAFGQGNGAFVLRLNSLEATPLAYSTPETVTFSGAAPVLVQFDGEAGDVVNVYTNSGSAELDTKLTLLDSTGMVVAEDDDSGLSLEPAIIRQPLAETGTYYVLVASARDEELEGPVTLTVEETMLLNLDDGPVSVTVGELFEYEVVRFTADLNARYRMTVTSEVPFDLTLEIGDFFDGSEMRLDNVLRGSFDFVAVAAGETILRVRSGFSDAATVEIAFTPVE